MTPRIGSSLGRYRLEASLGKGGMAEVFRAVDEQLGRTVAVKVILPSCLEQPEFRDRFLREARVVAGLEHPNIVPVYDVGEQDGVPYLVMPYLDGGTLVERLRAGQVPLSTITHWVEQLAAALDAAHERGILHRDVKPGNVLIGRNDRVLLADFGIAKAAEGATHLTATGVVIGTPVYMAPEIVQGGAASPASDLYALAVITYELLTGRPPFAGESALAVLHQHVHTPPPRPSTQGGAVPATLDPVLAAGLAKDPAERPPTCRAFASALAATASVREGRAATLALPTEIGMRPTQALPGTGATLIEPAPRPVGARLAVAFVLFAVSIGGWLLFAKMRQAPPAPPPALGAGTAPATATESGGTAASPGGSAIDAATASPAAPAPAPAIEPAAPPPAAAPAATAAAATVDAPASPPPVAASGSTEDSSDARPRAGRGGLAARAEAKAPRPGMTRLTAADLQRMLSNSERAGRLGDQRGEALRTYAEGGVAYLKGDLATAEQRLKEASRMTGAAAIETGPVGILRRLAGGAYPSWAVGLAYGDGRGDAAGLLAEELRARPNNLAARFGQAMVAHLDGRHGEAAAIAEELRARAPDGLSQRLDFYAREERLHLR